MSSACTMRVCVYDIDAIRTRVARVWCMTGDMPRRRFVHLSQSTDAYIA